jgi:methyl-accepting chemotaxis protein
MFGLSRDESKIQKAVLAALSKSQAVIEFSPDGHILTANENFLSAMGYQLDEVKGRHHSMFVEADYAKSEEYLSFWKRLRDGQFQAGEYKRIGKGRREVWIEASYNPITDEGGAVVKVVKYATDITTKKLQFSDLSGQLAAISKSQAVIHFNLDGTIITANENFLNAVGYSLDEVKGRHHRMFVESHVADSSEYREFWESLRTGHYQANQYRRVGKGGRPIWIEASYNPIFDMNGRPFKVVKYATDITKQISFMTDVRQLIERNIGQIDTAIKDADHQAFNASTAAAETSKNVQTVATGAEEMSASVREISQSMVKSLSAVTGAKQQADAADQATQRLNQAAASMGGIVGLIQQIAGQINLLALNATIEAARAGDAGKGFAVVAAEVKNLAKQAGDATEQINAEIASMQVVSKDVVTNLMQIRDTIDVIQNNVSGTAGAVEEQSAVTQNISFNMQQASAAVARISENITTIARSIETASASVSNTQQAAQSMIK